MKKFIENEQLPAEDKMLFEVMEQGKMTENEARFFKEMKHKELCEFPVTVFDTLLSEYDNEEGLYFVKCYYSEYLIGRNSPDFKAKLDFVPSCLKEALDADLFQLLNRHVSLLEWLRNRDFKGVRYDYEWEE